LRELMVQLHAQLLDKRENETQHHQAMSSRESELFVNHKPSSKESPNNQENQHQESSNVLNKKVVNHQ
jgi:hypothetical protein